MRIRVFVTSLLCALVVGCAALGISAPQSFAEKDLAAVLAIQGVEQSTLTLLNAKTISAADAQNVETGRNVAIQGLAIARSMAVTNPTGATTKLDAVIAGLTALQTYLATKGAK